nr:flavin monoamine oxidase family protein [Chengkuizengella marina]
MSFQLLNQQHMLSIIRNGIKKTHSPKHIIVVGAGVAGLVTASLLKDAGHKVTILEANNKVGGRVNTLRSPFSNELFFNAGAMRIPNFHYLSLEYVKKFKLSTNLFIYQTPMDLLYVNGVKIRRGKFERKPSLLNYPVNPNERDKTAEYLMLLALQPYFDFIKQDPEKNWPIVEKNNRKLSFRFLLNSVYSESVVDMIGTLLNMESFLGISLNEVLRQMEFFKSTTCYYEISGGMDRLPMAFLPQLNENIKFNQKIIKIENLNNSVNIQSINQKNSKPFNITGDLAIVTIPFSTLRFVKIEPYDSFSYHKRKAIRELNYMTSTKIAIEFKSRFWEKEGQFGGKTVTDLPIRFTYFPSHGLGTKGNAIVLASYTWEDDALMWDSLDEGERIQYALMNLAEIYGNQVYFEFVTGASFSWGQNSYSAGAFSAYNPGQKIELYPYLTVPQGRVHFAGEHTSITHGWIQGAIESGIRVAYEVNNLPT